MTVEALNGRNGQVAQTGSDGAACPLRGCPACGGQNSQDAVFCANPDCRKALGEFPFILEEMRAETPWHETLAERIARFIGRPHFLAVHAVWFALWILVNAGLLMVIRKFDDYPFGLLGIILSIEAVFITSLLLIGSNRQGAHAERRAELDYEVNVRTYRQIQEIARSVDTLEARLDRIEDALGSRADRAKGGPDHGR